MSLLSCSPLLRFLLLSLSSLAFAHRPLHCKSSSFARESVIATFSEPSCCVCVYLSLFPHTSAAGVAIFRSSVPTCFLHFASRQCPSRIHSWSNLLYPVCLALRFFHPGLVFCPALSHSFRFFPLSLSPTPSQSESLTFSLPVPASILPSRLTETPLKLSSLSVFRFLP